MSPRPVRSLSPLRLASGVTALLAFLSGPAHAELVEHSFTGTLDHVTDGTGGTLDLTGTFFPGQVLTFVVVVDRSTPGQVVTDVHTAYLDTAPSWSLDIGTYERPAAPPISPIAIFMVNDLDGSASLGRGAGGSLAGSMEDRFYLVITSPGLPLVGSASASHVVVDLSDDDGTVWPDEQLPRTIPELSEFEYAVCRVDYVSDTALGSITAIIGDVTTPARATTWGRLKSNYRD